MVSRTAHPRRVGPLAAAAAAPSHRAGPWRRLSGRAHRCGRSELLHKIGPCDELPEIRALFEQLSPPQGWGSRRHLPGKGSPEQREPSATLGTDAHGVPVVVELGVAPNRSEESDLSLDGWCPAWGERERERAPCGDRNPTEKGAGGGLLGDPNPVPKGTRVPSSSSSSSSSSHRDPPCSESMGGDWPSDEEGPGEPPPATHRHRARWVRSTKANGSEASGSVRFHPRRLSTHANGNVV